MTADPRIKARAIVDQVKPGRKPLWRVIVTGYPPHEEERIYRIKAKVDEDAAFEGINRFVAEMEGRNVGACSSESPSAG